VKTKEQQVGPTKTIAQRVKQPTTDSKWGVAPLEPTSDPSLCMHTRENTFLCKGNLRGREEAAQQLDYVSHFLPCVWLST